MILVHFCLLSPNFETTGANINTGIKFLSGCGLNRILWYGEVSEKTDVEPQ